MKGNDLSAFIDEGVGDRSSNVSGAVMINGKLRARLFSTP